METLYALVVSSFRFMTPTEATSSYAPLLVWEGEIDGACHTLTIAPSSEATVALCGDAPSDTPSSTTILTINTEWAAIQAHFGTVSGETNMGTILFQGQGSATGAQWAQALATWASFTAMEIKAGRVGAAARTTLAWQITDTAEHSGQCSQLLVLAYGYAYANLIPCDSDGNSNGQATSVAMGWLSDTELDTFTEWVSDGARVEGDAGYLDAKGSTPITADEITTWAKAVYARMLQ
jgi:hypothetical protein